MASEQDAPTTAGMITFVHHSSSNSRQTLLSLFVFVYCSLPKSGALCKTVVVHLGWHLQVGLPVARMRFPPTYKFGSSLNTGGPRIQF